MMLLTEKVLVWLPFHRQEVFAALHLRACRDMSSRVPVGEVSYCYVRSGHAVIKKACILTL